ncbi:hypothetical protein B0T09DRAFT_334499 [Sordaria sp. MPI-SDFR-AT-0083]|nr:hypothetical protein B0T09DRAFT_334499 [Sordaria sp. MPI-SDFR-AT-0083]
MEAPLAGLRYLLPALLPVVHDGMGWITVASTTPSSLLTVRFLPYTTNSQITKSLAAPPPCCLAYSWTSCQSHSVMLDRGGSRWIPEWPAIRKVGRRHRLILGGQGDLPAANTLWEGFRTSEASGRLVSTFNVLATGSPLMIPVYCSPAGVVTAVCRSCSTGS